MLPREGHLGEYVCLSLVHDGGELGRLGTDLVGKGPPLTAGRLGRFLGEGGGDERTGDPPPALAGIGQHLAHDVHVAGICPAWAARH